MKIKNNNKIINMNFQINFEIFFILIGFFIMLSFVNISWNLNESIKQSNFFKISEITLKVSSENTFTILFFEFFAGYNPNEIFINGTSSNLIRHEYYFFNSENCINTFKIKWYYDIPNTNYMFKNCKGIIEIDLSHFNSQVNDDRNVL